MLRAATGEVPCEPQIGAESDTGELLDDDGDAAMPGGVCDGQVNTGPEGHSAGQFDLSQELARVMDSMPELHRVSAVENGRGGYYDSDNQSPTTALATGDSSSSQVTSNTGNCATVGQNTAEHYSPAEVVDQRRGTKRRTSPLFELALRKRARTHGDDFQIPPLPIISDAVVTQLEAILPPPPTATFQ